MCLSVCYSNDETDLCVVCCSYMDTELYEEAVRDYEKVYQTEKTKGEDQDRRSLSASLIHGALL